MASQTSSPVSYKSTHSSRSSVLERAREYNRRIDEQKGNMHYGTVGANQSFNEAFYMKSSSNAYYDRRRSKSLERGSETAGSVSETDNASHPRSHSAGRAAPIPQSRQPPGVTMTSSPTRNRAMASVQKQPSSYRPDVRRPAEKMGPPAHQPRATPGRVRGAVDTPTTATTTTTHHSSQNQTASNHPSGSTRNVPKDEKKDEVVPPAGGPVVTPELLVDALSGHEDGLLAIAEKLMEHYDSGYDVMGEAIIDAFADVQKLFQHGTFVVWIRRLLFRPVLTFGCLVLQLLRRLTWKARRLKRRAETRSRNNDRKMDDFVVIVPWLRRNTVLQRPPVLRRLVRRATMSSLIKMSKTYWRMRSVKVQFFAMNEKMSNVTTCILQPVKMPVRYCLWIRTIAEGYSCPSPEPSP